MGHWEHIKKGGIHPNTVQLSAHTHDFVILRGAKRSRRIYAAVDEDASHRFRDFARNDDLN